LASELILPGETTTIISPFGICDADGGNGRAGEQPILLVVVTSAVRNTNERRIVRESWARSSMVPSPKARVIFLLGQSVNGSFQEAIAKESSLYGDILQEGFVDSYANLTVKSLMMLKWFTQHCDKVPYVLKTDDDVFVNVNNLYRFVLGNKNPNLLTGTLICGAVPLRDPYNKWYAPKYMIASKTYPNYLSGTAYLMSRSMAQILLEASSEVPIFHLEDIYVTGLLSQYVSMRPEDHRGFSYLKSRLNACLYSQIVSSHHLSEKEMLSMANQVERVKGCKVLKKEHLRRYAPGKCTWPKSKTKGGSSSKKQ
jgi:beta-1,3-galactosyltransferase 1